MEFAGMQNLSLLDFPGKVACILFVRGCNLRCPFCHNASLVRPGAENAIVDADVLSFLKKRQKLLDGIVISGGEPLMYPDLLPFLQKVRNLGYAIKVDTNGTNPELLKQLVSENLADYVAMDIKNSPAFYSATCGLPKAPIGAIDQSREFLMSDVVDYEFRTTVVQGLHTRESIKELACWIAGAKRYYLQCFKDSGDLLSPDNLSAFSDEEMQKFLEITKVYIPNAALRGI
ncbi:MAG: anaerobic ribonucleoside-triphosphate reductase activating protein [Ruminococcaceae bacterium]|nr:anaerobic ribonucleoside-triphosphate reductase activating protein [Oscillospiraceae bacterium]